METARDNDTILLRLDKGEEIISKLKEVRDQYDIKGGFFEGVGAVDKVKLGNYNVNQQNYREKELEGSFEVSSFLGNIGPDKIHAHITLADADYKAKAGHCSEARVSGTFELIIFTSEHSLSHHYDSETGLDVFDFSQIAANEGQ